jgi:hypothetical protein
MYLVIRLYIYTAKPSKANQSQAKPSKSKQSQKKPKKAKQSQSSQANPRKAKFQFNFNLAQSNFS